MLRREGPGTSLSHRGAARFDALFAGTVIVLAIGSVASFTIPGLSLRVVAPALDLTLDNVSLIVTGAVAALAWIRYRERGEPFAFYQAVAFLVLALASLAAVVTTLAMGSSLTPTEPPSNHLYVFLEARLLAGGLLVAGGIQSLRGRAPKRPRLVIVASVLAMVVVIATVAFGVPLMPLAYRLEQGLSAPVETPVAVALHTFGAILFAAAARISSLLWRRDGAVGDKYVAFGLMLAAFALLHGAFFPGTHPGPVTSADVLLLAFALMLLLAIEAEASSVLRSLRLANRKLEELRVVEVEKAATDERARLGRELHDGLAQALWLAKLKIARLESARDLSAEERTLVEEASQAVELGLAEARQAVMAMHIASQTDASFGKLMKRYLQDYSDRLGMRVEFDDADDLPPLPARTQAELLRIAQEALANVHRHADADRVDVRIEYNDGEMTMAIIDDGSGFDVSAVQDARFGLAGMRERATIIGGRLTIESVPGSGATVLVRAPVTAGAGAAGGESK